LGRKYDNLSADKEDLLKEINTLNGKLNDNNKKNQIMETEILEREKDKNDLLSDLRKYEKDLKFLKEQNENYLNKLDKVKIYINLIKKKKFIKEKFNKNIFFSLIKISKEKIKSAQI
jgi:chromosome segregation ATPase